MHGHAKGWETYHGKGYATINSGKGSSAYSHVVAGVEDVTDEGQAKEEADVQEEKGKDAQAKEERDKQKEEATGDMEPKEEAGAKEQEGMAEEQEDEVYQEVETDMEGWVAIG